MNSNENTIRASGGSETKTPTINSVKTEDVEVKEDKKEKNKKYSPFIQGSLETPEMIKRRNSKIGRNSPCPCGSGKKYKKCCEWEKNVN